MKEEKELIRELKIINNNNLLLNEKIIDRIFEIKDILKNQYNYSDEKIRKSIDL